MQHVMLLRKLCNRTLRKVVTGRLFRLIEAIINSMESAWPLQAVLTIPPGNIPENLV